MGKLKSFFQNLSLRRSIACYIVFFAAAALLLSNLTASVCSSLSLSIHAKYHAAQERYYLTNEKGERLGEGTYISTEPDPMTAADQRLDSLLDILPVIAAPIYSALCLLAAVFLFYRNKLRRPLALLTEASARISGNDLDFSVSYDRRDEMGQLCAAFETMRSALAENHTRMWRQMEERKCLNAAFAHDLRTPLTVLKGYNEMLQLSSDSPQTRETAAIMERHLTRLEHYADSMSQLQRLEDMQPSCRPVRLQELAAGLNGSAILFCQSRGKQFHFENHTHSAQAILDAEILSQVFENLLSNAARHARFAITATLDEAPGGLRLTITDDGPGFTPEALSKALQPYYSEDKNHAEHFGLGLYICRILCEHHGGGLEIKNSDAGGSATAFLRAQCTS